MMRAYRASLRPSVLPISLVSGLLAVLVLAACGGGTPASSSPGIETAPTTQVPVSSSASGATFSRDVQPILEANCTRCHGSTRQSGGLRLSSFSALMAGGLDGAVILPGDADGSLLVQLVSTGSMPRNASRLSDADQQTIRDWINAGALDN